jgi:hypothetical protein
MTKILYANGCSWTAGNGIEFDPSLSSVDKNERWRYQLNSSWPSILAKKLNKECINQSEGAGSNKRMVRTSCDFINSLNPAQYKDTLVVLGWTTVDRNELFLEENNINEWCKFNATQSISSHTHKFSKTFIKDIDKMYITNVFNYKANYTYFLQEMFLMSNLLENLGIKYLFFSSLPWRNCWTHDGNIDIQEMFNTQLKNLKKPNILNTRACDESLNIMAEFCRINKLPMAPDHHTMIEGHAAWAEHLYKELLVIYPE